MKQLPSYYTQLVAKDTAEARRALGRYLQTCATKGWRVDASDPEDQKSFMKSSKPVFTKEDDGNG